MVLKSPTDKEHLRAWINERIVQDFYISLIAVLILLGVNFVFYKYLEKRQHKFDLVWLALFDIAILSFAAWLAGQDAYFGLLEELNRNG